MINIEHSLQMAWNSSDDWSHILASIMGWTMSLTMNTETDWEPDEGWLTINRNGKWVGYLNADIPLLIRTDQLS